MLVHTLCGCAAGISALSEQKVYQEIDQNSFAWNVFNEQGVLQGGIIRCGGILCVILTDFDAAEQTAEFLHMMMPNILILTDPFTAQLLASYDFCIMRSGDVLQAPNHGASVLLSGEYQQIEQPSLFHMYNLLCKAYPGFDRMMGRDDFVADAFLKKSRLGTPIFGIVSGLDQTLLACAGIFAVFEQTCVLSAVATDPEHRGKGLGQALISSAIQWSHDQGKNLLLQTENPTITHYYEKLGFQKIDTWVEIKGEQG